MWCGIALSAAGCSGTNTKDNFDDSLPTECAPVDLTRHAKPAFFRVTSLKSSLIELNSNESLKRRRRVGNLEMVPAQPVCSTIQGRVRRAELRWLGVPCPPHTALSVRRAWPPSRLPACLGLNGPLWTPATPPSSHSCYRGGRRTTGGGGRRWGVCGGGRGLGSGGLGPLHPFGLGRH